MSLPPKQPLPPCPGSPGRVEPPPINQRKNTVLRTVDVRGKPPFPSSLPRDEDDGEDSDVDPTLYKSRRSMLMVEGGGRSKWEGARRW